MPERIAKNGSLTRFVRRTVITHLSKLRSMRETADYRMGSTVDKQSVVDALQWADYVFQLLEI